MSVDTTDVPGGLRRRRTRGRAARRAPAAESGAGARSACVRFDAIIGHDEAVDGLRRAVMVGRPAHAYLLSGPDGIGKTALATAMAAALQCPHREADGTACGQCDSCRRVGAGVHPDVAIVGPATEAGNITIEQIRALRQQMALTVGPGRWKVAIIEPAARMTAQAAGALLKTLEEPLGPAVLMLVTPDPGVLAPTIRSRCIHVSLRPVGVSRMAAGLREAARRGGMGPPPDQVELVARLSGGRPGRVLGDGGERLLARREQAWQWLKMALGSAPSEVDRFTHFGLGKAAAAEVDEVFDAVIWLWRDVAIWSWTKRETLLQVPPGEQAEQIRALGETISPRATLQSLERLIRARQMLREFASRRWVLNWALLSLRQKATG